MCEAGEVRFIPRPVAGLNSGRITLPRHDRLVSQIANLERTVSRGGKDTITHPPNGHDDIANAVAGAATVARASGWDPSMRWAFDDDPEDDGLTEQQRWRARRYQNFNTGLLTGGYR